MASKTQTSSNIDKDKDKDKDNDKAAPDDWTRRAFQSRHLDWGRFSPSRRVMEIQFASGKLYRFPASPGEWNDLLQAESAGKHFHRHFRGKHLL